MKSKDIQKKIDDKFREHFGYTPFKERISDIQNEFFELMKWQDVKNLKEETGDLLCSLIKLCSESGWDYEELILDTLSKIEHRAEQYKTLGRKTRVAILGLSANPPHKGHIQLAQFVLNTSGQFDEVWLMPNFRSISGKEMVSAEHRLKMWITKANFADIQTVFAKVGTDRILSAFIVEKDMPGVVIAPDEKKMGIKGSSTAQIFYNAVKVPVENMLGKQGEGFRIALSILHMGRIKLGANVIGASKKAINDSVKYANERKQFCVLISTFGAIKHKLAQQAIKTFAAESATYRVSKDIDDLIIINKASGMDHGRATIEGISHYAVEAAILKVYGSEALDYVIDEAVQIHGGMGYSAEMAVERGYRDSRINRIFEGTNEINRLIIADTAIKRAQKGEFDLFGPAEQLYNNLDTITSGKVDGETYYSEKRRYLANFKKVILIAIHGITTYFDKKLVKEQEVMNNLSEMIMETYIAESLALRVEKLESLKGNAEIFRDMLDVYVYDAADLIRKSARDAVNSFAEAEQSEKLNAAIEKLTLIAGVNVKEARRRIADRLIENNAYKF